MSPRLCRGGAEPSTAGTITIEKQFAILGKVLIFVIGRDVTSVGGEARVEKLHAEFEDGVEMVTSHGEANYQAIQLSVHKKRTERFINEVLEDWSTAVHDAGLFAKSTWHEPPGIDDARQKLCETINLVKKELAGDETPLVLGGFSQGAMLTMETALRGSIDPPKCLVQFSGTVICETQWSAAMDRLANTAVYQSHGQSDPILPYSSAVRLQELLKAGGVDVQFHSFDGPHTIDQESIYHLVDMLRSL